MILLAYRHALRVSELVALRKDQVDFEQGTLHVNRLKNGVPSVHPLRGLEIRTLRQLWRDYPESPYIFVSERGGPMTASNVRKVIAMVGKLAELGFPVHPHMLRHATGFYLASKGQDTRAIQAYMGHKNIQHTVRYTELAPDRFKNFWKDLGGAAGGTERATTGPPWRAYRGKCDLQGGNIPTDEFSIHLLRVSAPYFFQLS